MGDQEREEALAQPWVELWYDPTIPAIVTSDGKRVKYVGSVATTQNKSSKPGVVTGTIAMVRLPVVMVGAMRNDLSEAQTRVETYLGLPEPDPSEAPEEPF